MERNARRIALWASRKWKRFVAKKRNVRRLEATESLGEVVDLARRQHDEEAGHSREETPLLAASKSVASQSGAGWFGFLGFRNNP